MRQLVVVAILLSAAGLHAQPPEPQWEAFLVAGERDRRAADAALEVITAAWRDAYAGMIVDVARFLPPPRGARASDSPDGLDFDDATDGRGGGELGRDMPSAVRQPPGSDIRRRLTAFLEKRTGKRFGDDLRAWRRWIWSLPPAPHAQPSPTAGWVWTIAPPAPSTACTSPALTCCHCSAAGSPIA
jgi:hypothetical protein